MTKIFVQRRLIIDSNQPWSQTSHCTASSAWTCVFPLPHDALILFSKWKATPIPLCSFLIQWNKPLILHIMSLLACGRTLTCNLSSSLETECSSGSCRPACHGDNWPLFHRSGSQALFKPEHWYINLPTPSILLTPATAFTCPPSLPLLPLLGPTSSVRKWGLKHVTIVPTFTLHRHTSSSIKRWRKKPLNFPC